MTKASKIGGAADFIIPLGVVGLGALIIYKFFFSGSAGTSPGVSQANQVATDANQAGTSATANQQAAKGEKQTISPDTAAGIANTVFTLGQMNNPDLSSINNVITQVNNLTDLNAVIAAFGTRSSATNSSLLDPCYALGLNCSRLDMPSFIKLIYSQDATGAFLPSLNQFLRDQSINFQF
jgi:hypothetical protein